MSLATSVPQKYLIPDFFGKKEDERIKNFLVTQQSISTAILGPLIACGISQAINKKPDRKSGIIAACLSGVVLAATTISNIATWKNTRKMRKPGGVIHILTPALSLRRRGRIIIFKFKVLP